MRRSIQLVALSCFPLAAQQTVAPVAFSETRHAVRVFIGGGEVSLPVLRLKLDIVYPRGKKERGDLTVVYDPQYGHYLWRYTPYGEFGSFVDGMESGVERFYVTPDALIDFYSPGALYVKENRGQAVSLDAAEKASITEISQGLEAHEGGYGYDAKEVGIALAIGREFACAPYPESGQNCGFSVKSIALISRVGDTWRLVLRNRWDQEVILDSKFNLISTRRLAAPPKE